MTEISVIVPARNEEGMIAQTLKHIADSCAAYEAGQRVTAACEILVVDNASLDRTADVVRDFKTSLPVRLLPLTTLGAARARNWGRQHARGRILVFVDADTALPEPAIRRIAGHCGDDLIAGITLLGTLEGGLRSRLWWSFWNSVRRLPIPRAKAMPACMFCTAEAFDRFGPFDERVAIGEEWPILAGLYRETPSSLVYDRQIVARSSSRRMDQQAFGYLRVFLKYVWAILHFRGRVHYTDRFR